MSAGSTGEDAMVPQPGGASLACRIPGGNPATVFLTYSPLNFLAHEMILDYHTQDYIKIILHSC